MGIRSDNYERGLNSLLEQIRAIDDDYIKAEMSKYFCVRISGYMEATIKELISDYTDKSCPKQVSSYVQSTMKNISSLNAEKTYRLLEKFSTDWSEKFKEEVSEQCKSSLDAVISNRHNIAHGQQNSLSFRQVEQYYNDIKSVITILKDIIKSR